MNENIEIIKLNESVKSDKVCYFIKITFLEIKKQIRCSAFERAVPGHPPTPEFFLPGDECCPRPFSLCRHGGRHLSPTRWTQSLQRPLLEVSII